MKKCKGCGALLQNENSLEKGFTPRTEVDLCQRCFRINHYDDLTKSYKGDFDNFDILNSVSEIDGLILWVVDLFDFESNIVAGLNRHLLNKDIIMVGTKRDLLPDTVGSQKLLTFIQRRLKFHGISVLEILFVGDHGYDGREEVLKAIDLYGNNRDVVIMGQANAGKSTLINAIAESDLTISRYPGTTLDLIMIDKNEYKIYDTPGLIRKDNMQYYVSDHDLKKIIPSKVKPIVFQVSKATSFAIGGLVRVDVEVKDKSSVVFYVNQSLNIHRGSHNKADELWQQHKGELLKPISEGEYKFVADLKILSDNYDLVINGLGFVNFKGQIKSLKVQINEEVSVIVREAII